MATTGRRTSSKGAKPETVVAPATPNFAETAYSVFGMSFSVPRYNPDTLTRRKGGLRVYDDMLQDDQVKYCLAFKKNSVIAPGWEVKPASDSPKDVEIADFITYCFKRLRGSFSDDLLQMLSALDYGFSISELNYMLLDRGPYKGKIALKSIKQKKPHHYDFAVDAFDNLLPDGLWLTGVGGITKLQPEKFVIYTYQRRFENFYGDSDLRPAYRNWWSKDALTKFWNVYLERFGNPLTLGKYKNADAAGISALRSMLQSLNTKSSAVFKEGDYDISFLEPLRRSSGDYDAALAFHNRAIARALLIPDKLAEGGSTGAYAQAEVHFNMYRLTISQLRGALEEAVVGEQIIKRLCDYNFGELEEYPRFQFRPMTEEQELEMLKTFGALVQQGAMTSEVEDQEHIRNALKFPKVGMQDQAPPAQDAAAKAVKKASSDAPAKHYAKRTLTNYEKRVNFTRIDKDLKSLEAKHLDAMKEILTKQRDALSAFVASKVVNGKMQASLITSLQLRYTNELRAAFKALFDEAYKTGSNDAIGELPKAFAVVKQKQGSAVTPQKAVEYLNAKSDFSATKITEPLLRDIKRVLLESLRSGASVKDTVARLERAYDPYLIEGVIQDDEVLAPYRLEAITRTELGEAYNYGRRAAFEDPDVSDYVIGYQFSEILDERTTEISEEIDGLTIRVTSEYLDYLSYPLHWNDRGMFIPVTKDDEPVEWTDESELARLAQKVAELKP